MSDEDGINARPYQGRHSKMKKLRNTGALAAAKGLVFYVRHYRAARRVRQSLIMMQQA